MTVHSEEPDLLLVGGRAIDPSTGRDGLADILVRGGRIAQIGTDLAGTAGVRNVLDVTGKIVAPGLIDMHVHLREPGQEYKETIRSGTGAAAAGGFTAVAAMPNTDPPIDHPEVVRTVLERAACAEARVHPIAAITMGRRGTQLVDMPALVEAGAVAFSDDGDGVQDVGLMRDALHGSRELGVPIIPHAEVRALAHGGHMHEGAVSERLGIPGIPALAEEMMIARDLMLLEYAGGHLHIAHVSTARSVHLIRKAKSMGLPVTCEVAPHHLILTDEEIRDRDPNHKMNPPLRTSRDVEALREGLVDGTVDAIASDHAPHAHAEKTGAFEKASFGIIGLETSLSLILTELVHPGLLTLSDAVEKMSTAPARILGTAGGTLDTGAPADLTVIDPDAEWTVDVDQFRSKARNTPFGGRRLTGKAVVTIFDGRVTHDLLTAES